MSRVLSIVFSLILALEIVSLVAEEDYEIAKKVAKDIKKVGNLDNNHPIMSALPSDSIEIKKKEVPKKTQCAPVNCPSDGIKLCVAVNGIPLTAFSMCHVEQKQQCYAKILRPGEKMPTFRVLHTGDCNGTEDSILKHRRVRRRSKLKDRMNRPN